MLSETKRLPEDSPRGAGRLTVTIGAGISAGAAIPAFRGPEGYWTVGSREFPPQEMAVQGDRGCFVQGPSSEILPQILEIFKSGRKTPPEWGEGFIPQRP